MSQIPGRSGQDRGAVQAPIHGARAENEEEKMIRGHFDKRGKPILRARVQILDQEGNPEGSEIEVDFTLATGAARTVLGPRDSERTGMDLPGKPVSTHSPYWQYNRQITREARAEIRFEDDWNDRPVFQEIAVADPNDRNASEDARSFLGMDTIRYWEMVMNQGEDILEATRGDDGTKPPKPKEAPGEEPTHIDQAFVASWSQLNGRDVRVTGEDLRRAAETLVGMEGIPGYHPGHGRDPVQARINGKDIELAFDAYTSASGKLQLWIGVSLPGTPERLIATGRLSWGDWSEGGARAHERLRKDMAVKAHQKSGIGPGR